MFNKFLGHKKNFGFQSAGPPANPYPFATGGTVTIVGNRRIHTIKTNDNFIVSNAGSLPYSQASYLIQGGGSSGTVGQTGVKLGTAGAGGTNRTGTKILTVGTFSAIVGAGGLGATAPDVNSQAGGDSSIFGITASGATAALYTGTGGNNADYSGGSIGGIGSGGGAGAGGSASGKIGGVGVSSSISGSSIKYGGGGSGSSGGEPNAGTDGGGSSAGIIGGDATSYGGGGGGDIWNGFTFPTRGGNGKEGVIIISYQFQP